MATMLLSRFVVMVVAAAVLVPSRSGADGESVDEGSSLAHHLTDRERVIQELVRRHDAKIPPNYEDNFPTDVTVQIYIMNFDSISEATMDYSMTIFLRQSWNDSRLQYTPLPGITALELDTRIMQKIWVPDLYFTNEKHATFHDVTVPNRAMHIYASGEVMYSARISMKLSCDMDLWRFPFDSQMCYISMESYSYSTENVIFHWHADPVQRRKDMSLPQFEFRDFSSMDCTKAYAGVASNYTCIRADFHLLRSYGYYMAQVYVPSLLVVILSWVSFWLDIDAVPARISLGLLTVLTMTTQSASARSNLPRVSYIKAIDLWMATCLFFVFAALIEFAFVNVNSRVEKRRQSVHGGLTLGAGPAKTPSRTDSGSGAEEENGGRKRLFSKTTMMRQRARFLDKVARIAFPVAFAVFNLIYWAFYMFYRPEGEH